MDTKYLIAKMLMTNTGIAMMDSGGEDGRGWQRIRKEMGIAHTNPLNDDELEKAVKYFEKQPENYLDYWQSDDDKETVSTDDVSPYKSTYHYLTEVLDTDELCDEFNDLPCDDWDGDYYGTSEAQCTWLEEHGFEEVSSGNSYNGESTLDETIQTTSLTREGSRDFPEYVLLQIHRGADVRGGYTDAKLFKLGQWQEYLDYNPVVDVQIGDKNFTTGYNGYSLTDEETDEPGEVKLSDVKKLGKE